MRASRAFLTTPESNLGVVGDDDRTSMSRAKRKLIWAICTAVASRRHLHDHLGAELTRSARSL
jgi:hypothetical protein